ncbi:hypothetical protein GCM10010172_11780 [Paractinoplanes ferrugineus]|uniref:Uncharacterized protein n=1 Tax=Paractinoplanes ferrugineus TaxID=113564 RepID=A0A919IXR8_9ACTN|nr:hypothetical protein [Actinoplanes ferrugineus]GIE09742.1 hypothetical protein Afe05nite_15820 [Actinoplanes ferrugineus]
MTTESRTPRPTIDQEAVTAHLRAARRRGTYSDLWTVVGDVPVLLAEVDRLARLLSRTRWDFANLLAGAQATLTADQDGDPDPLAYLRDEVAQHRAWVPPDDGELVE